MIRNNPMKPARISSTARPACPRSWRTPVNPIQATKPTTASTIPLRLSETANRVNRHSPTGGMASAILPASLNRIAWARLANPAKVPMASSVAE